MTWQTAVAILSIGMIVGLFGGYELRGWLGSRALQQLRDAAQSLLETLPRCDHCSRVATHAYRRGEERFCTEHAPNACPPYPRATAIKILKGLLGRERNL